MKIAISSDQIDIGSPFPETPFLARQYSMSGPLCIVSRNACLGAGPHYNVMFLEGSGGPAIGDVWSGLTHEKMARQFIPLRTSVTMSNVW